MGEKVIYDTIFARSFSRYDQKKLGYGAFLGCLLIAFSFCTVFKPYLGPLQVLNMRLSMDSGLKMLRMKDSSSTSMRIIVDDETSNSNSQIEMVVANDTTSSNQTISFNNLPLLPVLNDTIRNSSVMEISSNPPFSSADDNNDVRSNNSETPGISNDIAPISDLSVTVVNDMINHGNSSQQVRDFVPVKNVKPMCDMGGRTDICELNGDIRVNGKSSTVFMASTSSTQGENSSWIISPYARKRDEEAMRTVTKWSIKSGVIDGIPQCNQNHKVAAIIFSLAGYAGNNFHDYTDIVIPLYLTARQFNGQVKFLVTNKNPWWISKFQHVLRALSNYELIDIDKEENTHCFETVIVGLRRNLKELNIDPSKPPYHSMKDFREFLRSAYSLKKHTAIKMKDNIGKTRRFAAPRLLLLSRRRTRAFTNANEIAKMARKLGFKVIVAEATSDVAKIAQLVNSCDVLMGVHGAGLTNMVFLPENAILIQVLPIGGFEWLAKTDFGEPSKDMKLRYLEYKIQTEESTLIQQFPPGHDVLSNPYAIQAKGWYEFKSIYLQKQNVNLDLNRFRPILLKALELLHQ
ncbi:hypothetical protein COLO4_33953 [Corchorus olitorius]|uniref:Glycosyltransferase 61 catalytic domain-containing protein n=1 Tax=Corchorus olitorius TaxID=93759 RepID=A0A1R3GPU7_9ROSI|nr:hypothetical protein COLO4_33953 [Corchorus olitorius]